MGLWVYDVLKCMTFIIILFLRRYVKHLQGTVMESRVLATATSSSSHSDRGDLASSHNAGLSGCSSPVSNGASSSACSTAASNHSDTCNGPNGVCDGKKSKFLIFMKG